ncbi:MAG: hypothetical protein Q4G51_02955 [Dermatophilus congolensis]|nr:hypothetical protein [Dermatophilus congolensis]
MTTTTRSTLAPRTDRPAPTTSTYALAGALVLVAVIVGLLIPDRTVGAGGMEGMSMTHYMGLLSVNQPWNLILFMAVPVILAETLAITELAILFGNPPAWVHTLSRWAGLVVGPIMIAILVHLVRYAAIPLTTGGGWRGTADLIAVFAYLASAIPMIGITAVQLGLSGRDERSARKLHATFVGIFLVVAHIAMIFGMLDPAVMGWNPTHVMPGGGSMPGMHH